MQANIIAFGKIAEFINPIRLNLDGVNDTNALKIFLEKSYPTLKETAYLLAINKQLVINNMPLLDNAEIALLPPFSGG